MLRLQNNENTKKDYSGIRINELLRLETREVRVGDDLPVANEFAQRI